MMDRTLIPNRFQHNWRQIQALRFANASFRELWQDYCEVLESSQPPQESSADLKRLQADLERDIEEALDEAAADGATAVYNAINQ